MRRGCANHPKSFIMVRIPKHRRNAYAPRRTDARLCDRRARRQTDRRPNRPRDPAGAGRTDPDHPQRRRKPPAAALGQRGLRARPSDGAEEDRPAGAAVALHAAAQARHRRPRQRHPADRLRPHSRNRNRTLRRTGRPRDEAARVRIHGQALEPDLRRRRRPDHRQRPPRDGHDVLRPRGAARASLRAPARPTARSRSPKSRPKTSPRRSADRAARCGRRSRGRSAASRRRPRASWHTAQPAMRRRASTPAIPTPRPKPSRTRSPG